MTRVESPSAAYAGVGPGGAVFTDGVAEVDETTDAGAAALNYYRGAGYKVDGSVDNPDALPTPDVGDVDPVSVAAAVVVGSVLRDAAVDPQPGDFLPPVGAGDGANPHGPAVVSPEIHASGPAGIVPGEVFVEDPDKQQAREADYARARLVEQTPAGTAVAAVVDVDDRGPLGLSDPGSAEQARPVAVAPDDEDDEDRPARNDRKAAWVDYAVEQGADRDEAEAMTKDELVERYRPQG